MKQGENVKTFPEESKIKCKSRGTAQPSRQRGCFRKGVSGAGAWRPRKDTEDPWINRSPGLDNSSRLLGTGISEGCLEGEQTQRESGDFLEASPCRAGGQQLKGKVQH